MDAKKLMWDIGCGELTHGLTFYAVTPAQLEMLISKVTEDAAGLVAKAVAAEREQCALAVEAIEKHCIELDCDDPALFNVAAAIRARGDV